MLVGGDLLPATAVPESYPVRIAWNGIIVDDAEHEEDVVRRLREVMGHIWMDRADCIEKELSEILGSTELREYLRKPGKGGFWEDHISRYSKNRRKAPIYWRLQTSGRDYAL